MGWPRQMRYPRAPSARYNFEKKRISGYEAMEIFRVSRNVWGQETVLGLSWDLLPIFFFAGVVIVVSHAAYCRLTAGKRK